MSQIDEIIENYTRRLAAALRASPDGRLRLLAELLDTRDESVMALVREHVRAHAQVESSVIPGLLTGASRTGRDGWWTRLAYAIKPLMSDAFWGRYAGTLESVLDNIRGLRAAAQNSSVISARYLPGGVPASFDGEDLGLLPERLVETIMARVEPPEPPTTPEEDRALLWAVFRSFDLRRQGYTEDQIHTTWTNAPADYDWGSVTREVETIPAGPPFDFTSTWRKIETVDPAQIRRYESANYGIQPEDPRAVMARQRDQQAEFRKLQAERDELRQQAQTMSLADLKAQRYDLESRLGREFVRDLTSKVELRETQAREEEEQRARVQRITDAIGTANVVMQMSAPPSTFVTEVAGGAGATVESGLGGRSVVVRYSDGKITRFHVRGSLDLSKLGFQYTDVPDLAVRALSPRWPIHTLDLGGTPFYGDGNWSKDIRKVVDAKGRTVRRGGRLDELNAQIDEQRQAKRLTPIKHYDRAAAEPEEFDPAQYVPPGAQPELTREEVRAAGPQAGLAVKHLATFWADDPSRYGLNGPFVQPLRGGGYPGLAGARSIVGASDGHRLALLGAPGEAPGGKPDQMRVVGTDQNAERSRAAWAKLADASAAQVVAVARERPGLFGDGDAPDVLQVVQMRGYEAVTLPLRALQKLTKRLRPYRKESGRAAHDFGVYLFQDRIGFVGQSGGRDERREWAEIMQLPESVSEEGIKVALPYFYDMVEIAAANGLDAELWVDPRHSLVPVMLASPGLLVVTMPMRMDGNFARSVLLADIRKGRIEYPLPREHFHLAYGTPTIDAARPRFVVGDRTGAPAPTAADDRNDLRFDIGARRVEFDLAAARTYEPPEAEIPLQLTRAEADVVVELLENAGGDPADRAAFEQDWQRGRRFPRRDKSPFSQGYGLVLTSWPAVRWLASEVMEWAGPDGLGAARGQQIAEAVKSFPHHPPEFEWVSKSAAQAALRRHAYLLADMRKLVKPLVKKLEKLG